MTAKNASKTRARALQERTGWTYYECLLCVQTMSEQAIEALVTRRAKGARG